MRDNWRDAHNLVAKAIRKGRLEALIDGKTDCVDCGSVASEYDHRDYLKPLEVDPVCHRCNIRRGPAENHHPTQDRTKAVIQYSLDGEMLRSFKSIRGAERVTGVDNSHIIKCCKGEYRTSGGYVWAYKERKHAAARYK